MVSVRTLASIFKEHQITSIDFLKIDVEGYELEVINGNDWKKYRPKVLVVEATVRRKLNPLLKKHGYRLEFFDGLNNYYVDNSLKDITIHNYAGRVLGQGVYTRQETELLTALQRLEAQLEAQIEAAHQQSLSLRHLLRQLPKAGKQYIRRKVNHLRVWK